MANKKGEDGVWRRCGQQDKLCPVAFCCFLGENVALTSGFSFTLKFPRSYLKKGWNSLNFRTA